MDGWMNEQEVEIILGHFNHILSFPFPLLQPEQLQTSWRTSLLQQALRRIRYCKKHTGCCCVTIATGNNVFPRTGNGTVLVITDSITAKSGAVKYMFSCKISYLAKLKIALIQNSHGLFNYFTFCHFITVALCVVLLQLLRSFPERLQLFLC